MKELSIEQKAKAYDEAYKKVAVRFGSNVADEIFIEENDDERIRKELIDYFSGSHATYTFRGIPWDRVVAWLEKQGEYDRVVEKAKSEKQRVLLTETNGNANIDWDARSIDDVKILLKCGLEYIRTIEANKQILSDSRFGGCSSRIPTRYDKGIKQGEQKPAEWSEENEKMFEHIIAKATLHFSSINYLDEEEINFLKSLRPQNRWKPNEEQMDALRYVTNFDYGGHKATLVSLYEQLKKLK